MSVFSALDGVNQAALFVLAGFGVISLLNSLLVSLGHQMCDLKPAVHQMFEFVIFVCDEWRRVKRHLSAEPPGDPVAGAKDEP